MAQRNEDPEENSIRDENDEEAWEAALLAAFYRDNCPPAQRLGEFYLGYLADPERSALRDHLARCPHCRAELEELARFLAEDDSSPRPTRKVNPPLPS